MSHGRETIRIISARQASRKERMAYQTLVHELLVQAVKRAA